jgi:epoxyqueuosine reductase
MSDASTSIISLTELIRNEAIRLGFAACGFARVHELSEIKPIYNKWIELGYHASMDYMNRNNEKRLNPALLVENSKTVISLLYNYYTNDRLVNSTYKIAKYAFGTDYHDVIREKLTLLDQFIKKQTDDTVIQRDFIDTAPVMEKHWAQSAGLGWIGKNSCLVTRNYGSFVFISEIFTSLELEHDVPMKDYCGSCRKCIDACPTAAITEDRLINSNKCISYHTIESRCEIPVGLKGKFNDYVYGCDICQDVCPWNTKNAKSHNEPLFKLRSELEELSNYQLETINDSDFQRIFKKSAVKRTKLIGFKRNINFVKNSSF